MTKQGGEGREEEEDRARTRAARACTHAHTHKVSLTIETRRHNTNTNAHNNRPPVGQTGSFFGVLQSVHMFLASFFFFATLFLVSFFLSFFLFFAAGATKERRLWSNVLWPPFAESSDRSCYKSDATSRIHHVAGLPDPLSCVVAGKPPPPLPCCPPTPLAYV